MKRFSNYFLMFLLAASLLALVPTAKAQDDPPDRVARLNYMSGDVSMQPGGVDDWVKASLNRPLTSADRLWTASRARAELHVGSTALRLSGETSLTFSRLDNNTVQMSLAQGTLDLRVRQIYENETYEVDTPNASFTIARAGDYRFDVDSDGDVATAMVRSGEVEAWKGSQSITVHAGRLATFQGENFANNLGDAPGEDDFDRWAASRDRREDRAESARYVSSYMTGYEDLDGYGSWRTVDAYGPMWVPTVQAGWAPYRYGHWVWIDPWGWTWVDDASWGFAPFHYGRWVYYSGYWGWCPGPRILRPVYAPALVAWLGGSHWGIGISLGWVPLGWGEVYAPWYHASPRYWSYVNRTTVINNTTIINNTYNYYNGHGRRRDADLRYANYRVPGAVTGAPQAAVVGGQPIGRHGRAFNGDQLGEPMPMLGPRAQPSAKTVTGGRPQGPKPPERVLDRPVIARQPVPERPTTFAGRDRGMNGGMNGRPAGIGANPQPGPATQMATTPQPKPNIVRHDVPRPADREAGGRTANNDRWNVPMPRDNGVVRHDVPRPVDGEAASVQNPNASRVPRPVDDGGAKPNIVRRDVPRPQQGEGTTMRAPQGYQGGATAVPRHDVPRPADNGGRAMNNAPQATPRTYGGSSQPQYRPAPSAPPVRSGGEGMRGPSSNVESRPAPPQRQSAPPRQSAPQNSGPQNSGQSGSKGGNDHNRRP